jgi:putative restriction endonuclease
MHATVANTDRGWFEYLRGRSDLSEVNFWSPSPRRTFRGDPRTPFFFRLKAPVKAIGGFGFFAR